MCRIYVKRNEYQRFDTLYHAFRTSIPGADVLWDRRMRERRHLQAPAATVDRRWNERRISPPESWRALGFVVTQAQRDADHRAASSIPAPRRTTPAPRILSHGLVEPSVAELKGTFVRIAENLVTEIVRRLKAPPQARHPIASTPQMPSTSTTSQPACSPAAPPSAQPEAAFKLLWPPHAERN